MPTGKPKQGRRKNVTAKVKYEAIMLVLKQGLSIPQAATQMNLGKSTLNKYIVDFKRNGNQINMDEGSESGNESESKDMILSPTQQSNTRDLVNAKEKIKTLKYENSILKKAIGILSREE